MRALVIALTALPVLSLVSDWIGRRAVTVPLWSTLPPFRLVVWGTFVNDDGEVLDDFFILKLPAWEWGVDWSRDRECWLRLWLCWRGSRGWMTQWTPEE